LEQIADTQESLGDPNAKSSYKAAAQAYLAKIQSVHLENERGYHLEYAFCLWKSGDESTAREVYDKLRERFPKEFTFHYQRANMEFKLHHVDQAYSPAEQAFQNSYGDNRLKSGLLLAKILKAQGKTDDAKKTIAQTLASVKLPDDPSIRSSHYLKAIQDFQKNDL
jgi:tetratricopeptide (TPR) repeat protein